MQTPKEIRPARSSPRPCSASHRWDKIDRRNLSKEEIKALYQLGLDGGPHGLSDAQLEMLCDRCQVVIYGIFNPWPPEPLKKINWDGLYWRGLYPEKMKRKQNAQGDSQSPAKKL